MFLNIFAPINYLYFPQDTSAYDEFLCNPERPSCEFSLFSVFPNTDREIYYKAGAYRPRVDPPHPTRTRGWATQWTRKGIQRRAYLRHL